ncbi:pathogenesis-related protein 1B-like [Punica granatum]|uniref:Pathogenesis-related protein 1B-like n=1 Tax=Punica granatum TaxID=22663 RepID=A0A6P8DNU6_PUNGR|nr:pathogenesis-related protein 1B-like [Punica granatum]
MAHSMPIISLVEVIILVSIVSACTVHARGVNRAGAGGVAFHATGKGHAADGTTAGAGVSHGISDALTGASQGGNNAEVSVSPGNNGASVGVTSGSNPSASTPMPHRGITSPVPGVPVARAVEFLGAHNEVRASLNEPPLQWDNGLAQYARGFAAKRALDCKMLHSYGPYGENIFWGEKDVWTPTQVVESWVSEDKYYDKTNNVCAPGQMCGHYTQVAWLDTTKVGCAIVTCLNGGSYAICNYDPPGNYVNESPFKHFQG